MNIRTIRRPAPFTEYERAVLANFILSLAIMAAVGFVIGRAIFGA